MKKDLTAAWIAILVVALVQASGAEDDLRRRTAQFEYRVIIEKLQGNDGRVSAISDWRREARFRAGQWEQVTHSLAAASGIAAVAVTVTRWTWLLLMAFSVLAAGKAAHIAAIATGVI